MGEHRGTSVRVAGEPVHALVLMAFVAATALLAVAASRAVHRAPTTAPTGAPRSSP